MGQIGCLCAFGLRTGRSFWAIFSFGPVYKFSPFSCYKAFCITVSYDLNLILIAAVMLKPLIISVALITTSIMLFNFSMSYVNVFNYVLIAFIH